MSDLSDRSDTSASPTTPARQRCHPEQAFIRYSNYQLSPSARRPKRRTCPTCPTGPTQAPPQRRLRANAGIQSLCCQIHLSSQTFTDDHGQVDCFDSIKQQRQFLSFCFLCLFACFCHKPSMNRFLRVCPLRQFVFSRKICFGQ